MADVRLVDLEMFKRYSLAIRQEMAPVEEVLAVLDATRRQVEAVGGWSRPPAPDPEPESEPDIEPEGEPDSDDLYDDFAYRPPEEAPQPRASAASAPRRRVRKAPGPPRRGAVE